MRLAKLAILFIAVFALAGCASNKSRTGKGFEKKEHTGGGGRGVKRDSGTSKSAKTSKSGKTTRPGKTTSGGKAAHR